LPDAPLVLLVEDDRQAADLLRLQLEGGGFRVAVAADGEEGLVQARALRPAAIVLDVLRPAAIVLDVLRPAAIVLDVLRPRLGGWDFLAQAKADPLLAAIPVVIASVVDERGKGFALGAADYLVKPVGRDALVNTLARLGIAPGSRAAPTTILAIDDDPLATGLLAAILEPEGYRVLQAAGGEEGIALAVAERPALIVLDLTMPGTDGFAVVERLRGEPASAAIPIVILSARELTVADQARLAGRVSALARKGEFDRTAFVEVVRHCCGAAAGGTAER
jgi:CheY-like chemotaxis protein